MDTPPASRIVVIDVLRAVALIGIIITHAAMGFHAAPPPTANFMVFDQFDRVLGMAVGILADGKFFAIFSFLFGVSFSIQLESAARSNRQWAGRFAWRLAILFGIGALHQLIGLGHGGNLWTRAS
jgi:uncharacterized protein